MSIYNKIHFSCIKCRCEFTTNNLTRHISSCNGLPKPKKLTNCKYCNLILGDMTTSQRRNHLRWCEKNPKYAIYRSNLRSGFGTRGDAMREKASSKESRDKANIGISKAHADGKYKDAPTKRIATKKKNGTLLHTEETKLLLKEIALASPHQRVCRRTHEFVDKMGRKFLFDSSWEDALAVRLDDIGVLWDRPPPIQWVDNNGIVHHYFPDFYLPEYNLYLDPKNPWVQKEQSEKISIVSKIINLIIIGSLSGCENFDPRNIKALSPDDRTRTCIDSNYTSPV